VLEARADGDARGEARASEEARAEAEAGWDAGAEGVALLEPEKEQVFEFVAVKVGVATLLLLLLAEYERERVEEPEVVASGDCEEVADGVGAAVKLSNGEGVAEADAVGGAERDAAGEALAIEGDASGVLESIDVGEGSRVPRVDGVGVWQGESEGNSREARGDTEAEALPEEGGVPEGSGELVAATDELGQLVAELLCVVEPLPEKVSTEEPVAPAVARALALLLGQWEALPAAEGVPVGKGGDAVGEPDGEKEGASKEAMGDSDGEADSLVVTLLQGLGLPLKLAVGEGTLLAVALLKRVIDALPE
jgi:hypothetical protein